MSASTLLDEIVQTSSSTTPKAIQLHTRHDCTLAARVLQEGAANIAKQAKKLEDAYPREARTLAADAQAITAYILPAFREQQELPLVTQDALQGRIRTALAGVVRRGFAGLIAKVSEEGDEETQEERSRQALQYRESDLLRELALRIDAYGALVAERAYAAGYAARLNDPETLAMECVGALSSADI